MQYRIPSKKKQWEIYWLLITSPYNNIVNLHLMLQQLLVFGLFSIIRVIGPRFAESWTIGFKHVVRPSHEISATARQIVLKFWVMIELKYLRDIAKPFFYFWPR